MSPRLLKRSPLPWLHNSLKSTLMCYSITETLSVLPRKSSIILGKLQRFSKMFGNDCLAFEQRFENLWKSSESVRKSSENRQKSRHQYVYTINRILHARLFFFSSGILFIYFILEVTYNVHLQIHTDIIHSGPP